jgi:transcription antitermination factor NusG
MPAPGSTHESQHCESAVWCAVHVRSRHEKKVETVLTHKGFETFLPTYERRSAWADRNKIIREPMFPGYVFCRNSASGRVPILNTPGVLDIVGAGGTPLTINQQEIDAVRALVRSGLPCESVPELIPGTPVHMIRGPLKGVRGVVAGSGTMRLVISIEILHRSVLAEIERDWVLPERSPAAESGLARSVNVHQRNGAELVI